MLKLLNNFTHLTHYQSNAQNSPSQASTVHELWTSDVQTGFRKGRGTRDQIANIHWIIKKAREFQETSISALLTMPKPLTLWITTNCGKFFQRWEYQTTGPASWETCIQVRKQVRTGNGTTDWFQIGKGVCQGCILSARLFNLSAEYIKRNTGLEEAQAGIKIAGRNINNLRYADDTTLMAESEEELQERASWWKWKRRVKKLA